jgi:hypothetical protein
MAEIISEFPGRGGTAYPWDEWLDGQVRVLTPGEDFSNVVSVRASFYAAAKVRGLKGRTRVTRDGSLIIQALP